MGTIDTRSVRQRMISLAVGETTTFPIERYAYVTTQAYRLGRVFRRKYTCAVGELTVEVKRLPDPQPCLAE